MAFLTVDAYDLSDEFEREISKQYGVSIKDKSVPWAVVYEGEREQLVAMYNQNWTEGDVNDFLSESAPALAD